MKMNNKAGMSFNINRYGTEIAQVPNWQKVGGQPLEGEELEPLEF